ncbi:DUF4082 domain-containing protein, partial [Tranquillimonas alkanivorans]
LGLLSLPSHSLVLSITGSFYPWGRTTPAGALQPVTAEAGDVWIASYFAPEGKYSVTEEYFSHTDSSGPLTTFENSGVYAYGAEGSFPTQSYNASNYWIDVDFEATPTDTGTGGEDRLTGSHHADVLLGAAGDDLLTARWGDDILRGQDGDDQLEGQGGADILIGGAGDDQFEFSRSWHSRGHGRDEIQPGDGSAAFEGAGVDGGDIIDLRDIDANRWWGGDQAFTFGSTDIGGLSLVDVGDSTLVRGNTDGDARFEFEVMIQDGAEVSASDYSHLDFLL